MFKKEKTKTKKMIERITQSVVYILLLRGVSVLHGGKPGQRCS
jgi:hypothetical protein